MPGAMDLDEDEAAFVKTLDLLSYKPVIYVANVSKKTPLQSPIST